MGRGQRLKGAKFERDVADAFKARGIPARRGLGQARGGGAEVPDVDVELVHVECKVGARPDPWAALKQAEADMRPDVWPVAVVRRDRHEAVVAMRLADWLELFAAFRAEAGERAAVIVQVASNTVRGKAETP